MLHPMQGVDGNVRYVEDDGRIVADWNGVSNAMRFFPRHGEPFRVGYYGPRGLRQGLRQVMALAKRDVR